MQLGLTMHSQLSFSPSTRQGGKKEDMQKKEKYKLIETAVKEVNRRQTDKFYRGRGVLCHGLT